MRTLVVFMPSPDALDSRLDWSLMDADQVVTQGQAGPGQPPELPAGHGAERAVAVLPTAHVALRRVSVPAKSEREARRAAPFVVEDSFGSSLEALEIATGTADADGRRMVLAADAALVEHWRGRAVDLGVRPVHAIPDALLLDLHGGDLRLADWGGGLVHRLHEPAEEGLAAGVQIGAHPPELTALVLPALAARFELRAVILPPDVDPNLIALDSQPMKIKREPAPDRAQAAARLSKAQTDALPSLLGAALGAKADWPGLLKPFTRAAAIAGAALAAGLGLAAGEAIYLERQAEAYREASRAAFAEAFPDTRLVNPRAQLNQRLAVLGAGADGGAGFLELAAALDAVLAEVETVRVDTLRYDAERSALTASAAYGDFSDFEALQAAAEQGDLVVEDGGARQTETGVEGDFTVRRP